MSVWDCPGFSNKLTHLGGLILLCIGYFNSFLISELISVFLQISYLTGRILVSKFLAVCDFAVEITALIHSFFQVVYEDSLIFFKDAIEKFVFLLTVLKEFYLSFEKGIQLAYSFGSEIAKVVSVIVESVSSFGILLHLTVAAVKETLNLVGLTIWRFITSVPETLTAKVYGINDFILNTINEIFNFFAVFKDKVFQNVEKLYLFLFDIPLDSIYGLIVGGILLTVLCIKFKDICVLVTSAFLKLYKGAASFGISLWTGRFLEQKMVERNSYSGDDDRLCVICQFQSKEMIIFPCKHLCLCWDCSAQLVKTQNTCPICRSQIEETLKVYV